jgi:hypothetical protein
LYQGAETDQERRGDQVFVWYSGGNDGEGRERIVEQNRFQHRSLKPEETTIAISRTSTLRQP